VTADADRPRGSAVPLIDGYDALLLDLDGVIYRGSEQIPHARGTLATVRMHGSRVAYVTNNASRTPETVADQLNGLGIPTRSAEVVTSAQAAARLVADMVPAGSAVLVVGGAGLEAALLERSLRPVRSLADEPAAVIQGYAPDVDWRQLAEGSYAVQRGLPWVVANADLTIPTDRGIAPGNGTLVAAIRTATRETPIVAGKPELPLHHEAAMRTRANHPLVVGDRLDTDIEGANRAGVDSLLVLTGIATPAAAVTARPGQRPTYLGRDLRALLVAHPTVTAEADGAAYSCAGWSIRIDRGGVKIGGDGDPIDGLRALCAAAWAAESEPPAQSVAEACAAIGF
jgi:glycerol-1-phosphatase